MTNRTLTPEIQRLSQICLNNMQIDNELYQKFNVKRGLRDQSGSGVLVGLTDISEVNSMRTVDGIRYPMNGELFYRGYDIHDLIFGVSSQSCWGYEETLYLLLFLSDILLELRRLSGITTARKTTPNSKVCSAKA